MKKQTRTINMDDKQRVSLARILSKEEKENHYPFRIYREGAKIILEPVMEVPAKDHWSYKSPEALTSLMKGIKDVEEGRLYDLGSFAQYVTDDDEE